MTATITADQVAEHRRRIQGQIAATREVCAVGVANAAYPESGRAMSIPVTCSACGKTVRAHVRPPGLGFPLVRAHNVSEAAAMLLGVATGDVCPGSGRNDHQPKRAKAS